MDVLQTSPLKARQLRDLIDEIGLIGRIRAEIRLEHWRLSQDGEWESANELLLMNDLLEMAVSEIEKACIVE